MKLDVLAIAPHPDDVEINCGGTIAKCVRDGLNVGILDLTRGEMGTRGTIEKRAVESDKASQVLGIQWRKNLGLPDGALRNCEEFQNELIPIIRETQPGIVLFSGPSDRHPDHNHAHQLIFDSLFFAGLVNKLPHLNLEPWRPHHSLLYMHDTPFEPDLIMDVSEDFDTKLSSILCYDSQVNTHDNSERATYISGSDYYEMIKAKARFYGHRAGFEYGEAFQYSGGPIPFSGLNGLLSIQRKR